MFLTPIPLPESFMLAPISPASRTPRNWIPPFSYPSADIHFIYIQKTKKTKKTKKIDEENVQYF